jgi:hypothetical protein
MVIPRIVEKIVYAAICFYCISTESRFIEDDNFLQRANQSSDITDS